MSAARVAVMTLVLLGLLVAFAPAASACHREGTTMICLDYDSRGYPFQMCWYLSTKVPYHNTVYCLQPSDLGP